MRSFIVLGLAALVIGIGIAHHQATNVPERPNGSDTVHTVNDDPDSGNDTCEQVRKWAQRNGFEVENCTTEDTAPGHIYQQA